MRFRNAATSLALVLALTGCQRTFDSGSQNQVALAPAPLAAQPVPTVQSNQLPAATPAGGAQFPTAPTQQASIPGGATDAMSATALDVKKEGMVGNWRVSGSSSCDMFLTLTNLGSGSRGGTRGCAGELTAVRSWEVSGKQVQFKDSNGNLVGKVYKTADNKFDGSTASGQPITLSR